MVFLWIVLGIIGYIILSGTIGWVIDRFLKDQYMSMWLGIFWPITVPFLLLYVILCPILLGVEKVMNIWERMAGRNTSDRNAAEQESEIN